MLELKKILCAEDDPDIQIVVRLALQNVGKFTVEICSNGAEAVRSASEFQPDLILLDVMMPEMDGPAALSAIRRNPATAAIPIIFMTARSKPEEIEAFLKLGALDVIEKPFDPMTLDKILRKVWEQSQVKST